jgi:hypothetical protein
LGRLTNGFLETANDAADGLVWVILAGVAIPAATAQQANGVQQTSIGQNQSIMASIVAPVTGEPYQAEKVTRSVQKLSDGTVITHETRGMIARYAQGRMREELYISHFGNMNGRQMELEFQSATVGDPVTHTMLIWNGGPAKIATQMQLPSRPSPLRVAPKPGEIQMLKEDAPPPVVARTPRNGTGTVSLGTMPNLGMPNSPLIVAGGFGSNADVKTEQLGQQSIEGVLVTGKRVTTTIATGAVGNDRPIVVVHEEWRSPELKIVVKTIDSDPRTGEQTMELQELARADPDPSLFQAPAGYQVKDMADMLKTLGNTGAPRTP